jgi:hypothetical protein
MDILVDFVVNDKFFVRSVGVFCGQLEHFSRFGILYQENLATQRPSQIVHEFESHSRKRHIRFGWLVCHKIFLHLSFNRNEFPPTGTRMY